MSPEVIDESEPTLDDTSTIGRYYAIYNRSDSYPDGLGQDLVNGIPKDRKRYAGEIQLKTSSRETLTDFEQNG